MLLDLSMEVLTMVVSRLDMVELVLKPLNESLGQLVLLMWIWVCDDSMGL